MFNSVGLISGIGFFSLGPLSYLIAWSSKLLQPDTVAVPRKPRSRYSVSLCPSVRLYFCPISQTDSRNHTKYKFSWCISRWVCNWWYSFVLFFLYNSWPIYRVFLTHQLM